MNQNVAKLISSTLLCLTLLWGANALAAEGARAGKAIFVYGKVSVEAASGERRTLNRGDAVSEGDTVVTASNGRVQLQMADGGLMALRPGTEFLIEQFKVRDEQDITISEPRSFFVLIKGGFRSITGAIGKENKANYRVTTPVATIGIRGTDYDAMFCASDCAAYSKMLGKSVRDGLYVGVNSGGVVIETASGSIDLDAGEFGFAKDASSVPAQSEAAEEVLSAQPAAAAVTSSEAGEAVVAAAPTDESARPEVGVSSTDSAGNTNEFISGDPVDPAGTGAVAFTRYASETDSGVSVDAAPRRDANDRLVGFTNGAQEVLLSGATPINAGQDSDRDGATNLSWGRWADGDANVTVDGNTTSTAIDGSVHYVAAADGSVTPTVPVTGSASFDLVGNTDPTDNRGNVGTLGSASLSADFTAQTVDADVSLSFQETGEVWSASAQDVDINAADATFAGAFDSVEVTTELGVEQGSGDVSGFFSGNDSGDITGAGLGFSLDQGDVSVDGSAAFQRSD